MAPGQLPSHATITTRAAEAPSAKRALHDETSRRETVNPSKLIPLSAALNDGGLTVQFAKANPRMFLNRTHVL